MQLSLSIPFHLSSECDRWGRHDTCAAPQQYTETEMQTLMEEQWGEAHATACRRPALPECSEAEFYADLTAFLEARGETSNARTIRERRIQW